ncbi:MAG: amidohydrolase [Clostridia bacterium]|nr:amidohydrolase [Clostridia bacterium]
MNAQTYPVDQEMMVRIRRELHMYPERGWDLDRTAALVCHELDAIGIPYEFGKYGRNTIVATLNPDVTAFTIGLRADMDALPIEEADHGQPYISRHPGVMHACGHDAHTAMLLGTCKALWAIRDQIHCRVKFIFQPSEEARPSGANVMCQSGVMQDIDCIIMCHVNCVDDVHVISSNPSATNCSSVAFYITLGGKAVHVATPHAGIDALAAGVKIYNGIQMILSREVDPFDMCVMSVAVMQAGSTVSANADKCRMEGSLRCFKDETMAWARKRLEKLIRCVAEETGVTWELSWSGEPLPSAHNDPAMYDAFVRSARKVVGTDKVIHLPTSPGAEDFAYYEKEKPGLLFGLGMRNEAKHACYPAHTKNWDIDEDGLQTGARVFIQFVLDNMDGISGMKIPDKEQK